MRNSKIANELDVDLQSINLTKGKSRKEWISPLTGNSVSIEKASLDYYVKDGWKGYHREGGLILNLLKSMSFKSINGVNVDSYPEVIFKGHFAYKEHITDLNYLLSNVNKASRRSVVKNSKRMFPSKLVVMLNKLRSIENDNEYNYPDLNSDLIISLFDNSKKETLASIAHIFSTEPYTYRKGWPDLTIWKNGVVRFIEIKGPGDRLHESQKTVINDIIKPLKLKYTLMNVECE
jgi:hypothetical protein